MEIPEGWPTREMLIAARLGIKESKAMREMSDEWFTRKFKAAIAAAPTPPDQECGTAFSCPECGAECMHVSIPNAHWHKCKSCDWSSKPAQEDEPVYQINLGPDKWWDVDKEAFDQITINAPPKRILYARPQSDELRRAAEEVYALVKDNSSVPIRPVLNLKAALERK